MIIKRFIVNDMNEAMTRIRYELGNTAVIISQRKIKRPGIKGLFLPKQIEVTAAVENETSSGKDNKLQAKVKEIIEKSETVSKKGEHIEKESINNNSTENVIEKAEKPSIKNRNDIHEEDNTSSDLYKEISDMKNMIKSISDNKSLPVEREDEIEIRKLLKENDFDEEISEDIIKRYLLKNPEVREEYKEDLKEILKDMINISEEKDEDGAIILVGPTGVGKTTTIAKLAGKKSLIEKKKTALITIDTYRIGAVEQLKTYAEIMNIPFRVVVTLKDMDDAIEEFKDYDVLLIDTTGRSSKNTMQISELRAFISKVNTKNINLVVSATTKNNDIKSIIEGFKCLQYSKVIITKLDETSTYGSIMNIMCSSKKDVQYFTTGQNVPDDMTYFSEEKIIKLLLGDEKIC